MNRPAPFRPQPPAILIVLAASLLVFLVAAGSASAAGVVNGGFETGTLEGWQQTSASAENAGSWFAVSGTEAPISSRGAEIAALRREIAELETELERLENESEPTGAVEGELEDAEGFLEELETEPPHEWGNILPPFEGNFDAVADENDPSSMILYQDVTLGSGTPQQLSLYFNYRSYAPIAVPFPDSLSSEVSAENQQVRIDVMKVGSPPESLAPADILDTLYASTGPSDPEQIPWTHLTADLSAYAGQMVRIRIAAVDNEDFFNVGVDDVTISGPAPLPPPPSNAFTLGKLKRNLHKGTATLAVNVPGPGSVVLSTAQPPTRGGKKVKIKRDRVVKEAKRTVGAAGTTKLPVAAVGAALKHLKAKHSLKAKVQVTFTPTGGTANTMTKTVVLKLAKPKKK